MQISSSDPHPLLKTLQSLTIRENLKLLTRDLSLCDWASASSTSLIPLYLRSQLLISLVCRSPACNVFFPIHCLANFSLYLPPLLQLFLWKFQTNRKGNRVVQWTWTHARHLDAPAVNAFCHIYFTSPSEPPESYRHHDNP